MSVKQLGDFPGVLGRASWEVIASAATIAPKTDRVRLTGAVAVVNITKRNPFDIGPIHIINTDAAPNTWTAAGNIAVAGTQTRYKVISFHRDPATDKWYPSNVA